MALRNYTNLATPQSLTVAVAVGDVTLQVADTASFPDPPFILGLERGTATEEICLCTGKTATSFTVTRGFDGTTAEPHGIGAAVEHTVAGIDFREANEVAASLVDFGDMVFLGSGGDPETLAVGTVGEALLVEDVGGVALPGYGAINAGVIANRTRRVIIPAAECVNDGGTLTTVGTSPNATRVVSLANAATQGVLTLLPWPSDLVPASTINVHPWWAAAALSSGVFVMSVNTHVLRPSSGNATALDGAGTVGTVNVSNGGAAANVVARGAAVSRALGAGVEDGVLRLSMRRLGADASDTATVALYLVAIELSYTADM